MAIEDTINLLQALNQGITGIPPGAAPALTNYPTVIDFTPFVITWPADGSWYIKGAASKQALRTYRVICFVESLGVNDIPSRAVEAVQLLQRFIDAYITAANVAQADPPTYQVTIESGPDTPHTDGGLISSLTFGGKAYHGFELRIGVREYWL